MPCMWADHNHMASGPIVKPSQGTGPNLTGRHGMAPNFAPPQGMRADFAFKHGPGLWGGGFALPMHMQRFFVAQHAKSRMKEA